ncbi:hypothetical protein F5Y13DRAFT_206028 [Hypoxylon sp. FL1857]|nr:hypothetical protein F5Y13DRAFT_206028 [Hypoxylon sp. FL1857]
MSCLGFLSFWKINKKTAPTLSHAELCKNPKRQVLQYPQKLNEGYVDLEKETVVGNGHEIPRDKPAPSKQREHQEAWFNLTDTELQAEYKRCVAKAPKIGHEFLWFHRRDSLEEESIHAARGIKSVKPHQAKLPLKLCVVAGKLCDQLCPHCSNPEPRKPRTISAGRQAYERWRQQQQNRTKRSKTPAPAELRIEASPKTSYRRKDRSPDVPDSGYVTGDEYYGDGTSLRSSQSISNTDRQAVQT